MQLLRDLVDEIIHLNLHVTRYDGLTNPFFGETVGRVRVIYGDHDPKPAVWVGKFCFDSEARVTYDPSKDEYGLMVETQTTAKERLGL